jgi:hypothetical protein
MTSMAEIRENDAPIHTAIVDNGPLDNKLSFIIVSSPAPSHPSADLIQRVIQSIALIDGVVRPTIWIILDGYVVGPTDRTKRGKVTQAVADNYELYCETLIKHANDEHTNLFELPRNFQPRFEVVKLLTHTGFALAVQAGLQKCKTSHAMIIQHDRAFCKQLACMSELICCMEREGNEHIRYVGFPSSSSRTHASLVKQQYGLDCLTTDDARISVSMSSAVKSSDVMDCGACDTDGLALKACLQPLIFWYDSNHLCNVDRYLEIYFPYRNCPAVMKERLGIPAIREMILRSGDFIEDKFGQFQRNYLISLPKRLAAACISTLTEHTSSDADENIRIVTEGARSPYEKIDNEVLEAFRWYGSYLYWEDDRSDSGSNDFCRDYEEEESRSRGIEAARSGDGTLDISHAAVYVMHLRGRNYKPEYAAQQRQSAAASASLTT